MPYKSIYPDIDIPKCNILSYLFPQDASGSSSSPTHDDKPVWIDAAQAYSSTSSTPQSLSVPQMLLEIRRFATGMDRLSIPKATAIMVYTPNHIYVPLIYLAAAGSERMFTGANPIYTANEVAHQMRTIDAALVLVHPTLLENGVKAAKQAGIAINKVYSFSSDEKDRGQQKIVEIDGEKIAIKDWRSITAGIDDGQANHWKWNSLDGNKATTTVACINFSSGTTGLPKGVSITHYNLISNVMQNVVNRLEGTSLTVESFGRNERWLAFLPLYHAYGQLWTINMACKLRITVYVMARFVFEDFMAYVEKFRITSIQAVPPVVVMLSKRLETKKYDFSSVKHLMCGAAPLGLELQNEVSQKYNLVITQGWGMTETTCAGIMIPGTTNDQTGSIGYVISNTEVKLMDDDGNEVQEQGKPGELWIRGPQMLQGYWRNEQATKESKTEDGWFKTGDVAVCKENKFWIVDRKKELIKVKGLQVAPAELEALILEHKHVADVATVGVTIDGEEMPRAYVVLQESAKGKVGESEIQDFVAGKAAKHKHLTGGATFIDEVPKLASGKIVRKVMKEWAKRDAEKVSSTAKSRL